MNKRKSLIAGAVAASLVAPTSALAAVLLQDAHYEKQLRRAEAELYRLERMARDKLMDEKDEKDKRLMTVALKSTLYEGKKRFGFDEFDRRALRRSTRVMSSIAGLVAPAAAITTVLLLRKNWEKKMNDVEDFLVRAESTLGIHNARDTTERIVRVPMELCEANRQNPKSAKDLGIKEGMRVRRAYVLNKHHAHPKEMQHRMLQFQGPNCSMFIGFYPDERDELGLYYYDYAFSKAMFDANKCKNNACLLASLINSFSNTTMIGQTMKKRLIPLPRYHGPWLRVTKAHINLLDFMLKYGISDNFAAMGMDIYSKILPGMKFKYIPLLSTCQFDKISRSHNCATSAQAFLHRPVEFLNQLKDANHEAYLKFKKG